MITSLATLKANFIDVIIIKTVQLCNYSAENAIVQRDAPGGFTANVIIVGSGNVNIPTVIIH